MWDREEADTNNDVEGNEIEKKLGRTLGEL